MQTIDRQEAFSGTKDVAKALKFDEARLFAYLADTVEGFQGPANVSQFKGGQSNPTYLIEAASGNYVMRRKPPGKLLPSAHAVDREYRAMKALGDAGFPVPKAYTLCDDESIVGTMFYIMSFEEGRIIWYVHAPDETIDERRGIFAAMNKTMADLHMLDPAAVGLADFGKPDNYVGRQISRWSKQYVASQTGTVEEMNRLMTWLPENVPDQQASRVVHGDFRLDNMILKPDSPEVLAVLDWELSTLGDPVADFAYHCMQWNMPPTDSGAGTGSLMGLDLDAMGIPSLEAYVEDYEKKTGFAVMEHMDFFCAYNFFRLGAILQGIVGRVRDGTASNANAAAMAGLIKPLAETAWTYAKKAGAR